MSPMKYQITVVGHLDSGWADWFSGMAIAPSVGREDRPITTLTGVVADQPALHGILARIRDLNLTIVSVTRLEASRDRANGANS